MKEIQLFANHEVTSDGMRRPLDSHNRKSYTRPAVVGLRVHHCFRPLAFIQCKKHPTINEG